MKTVNHRLYVYVIVKWCLRRVGLFGALHSLNYEVLMYYSQYLYYGFLQLVTAWVFEPTQCVLVASLSLVQKQTHLTVSVDVVASSGSTLWVIRLLHLEVRLVCLKSCFVDSCDCLHLTGGMMIADFFRDSYKQWLYLGGENR